MGASKFWYEQAITLDEYRRRETAGEITRPITDDPIGETTGPRRRNNETASAAFTDNTPFDIATRRKPPTPTIHHGTYLGYLRCVTRDEGSCPDCRTAYAHRRRTVNAHQRGKHTNPHPDCPHCATGQDA